MDGEDLAFEIGFFEALLARDADNVEVLIALGHAYTRDRRYEDGLAVDLRLAALRPLDPIVHYNLACSQSLLGDLDAALASLERAVGLGYSDCEHMARDEDLVPLREAPRFRRLLAGMAADSPERRGLTASAKEDYGQ